jgi:hypothetical protein
MLAERLQRGPFLLPLNSGLLSRWSGVRIPPGASVQPYGIAGRGDISVRPTSCPTSAPNRMTEVVLTPEQERLALAIGDMYQAAAAARLLN